MRNRPLLPGGVLVLALGLGGCGPDSSPTPLTPSSLPVQPVVPAPTAGVFPPGTLTGVSLSGVVYELTPTGRKPIARALVYCELCGKETHTFATADDNGAYHFSGNLATGGRTRTGGLNPVRLSGPRSPNWKRLSNYAEWVLPRHPGMRGAESLQASRIAIF